MERLNKPTQSGLSTQALRVWGYVFLVLGMIGRGIFANRLLNINDLTSQQLLEQFEQNQMAMVYTVIALIMQALETCAVPIFAVLIVEKCRKSQELRPILFRLLGLAVISQLPYNFLMYGNWLYFGSLNPVCGLVFGVAMLYFYRRYAAKTFRDIAFRVVVTVAAILWSLMLNIDLGVCSIVLICVCWFVQKPAMRNMGGAVAAVACSLFSMFYVRAPMGFLPVHLYRGPEEDEEPQGLRDWIAYPVLLLATTIVGFLL